MIDLVKHSDGTIKVVVKCLKRAAIVQWAEGPFLAAAIAPIEETRGKGEEVLALSRAVAEKIRKLRAMKRVPLPYDLWTDPAEEPGVLADAVAAHLSGTIEQKQEILEAADVVTRLQKVLALMQSDKQPA